MKFSKSKYLIIAALSIFISISNAKAGNDNIPGDAKSVGMANSVIMLPNIMYIQNQASLGFIDTTFLTMYSSVQPKLQELSTYGVQWVMPMLKGGISLQIQRFGYNIYNENKFGIGYGKRLGKNFSAGIQLNYLYTHLTKPYKSFNTFFAEVGIQGNFGKWYVGAHIYNPTLAKVNSSDDNEIANTTLRIGVGYLVAKGLIFTTETAKEINKTINYRFGINYKLNSKFIIQTGFQTEPQQFTIGTGFNLKQFSVHVAFNTNKYLDPTSNLALYYTF